MNDSRRTLGAILLIAGCCIGAGMLGLPLMVASAGFIPSSVAFFAAWAFMAATGLLLLEANLWFSDRIHLMTLAERTLGRGAKVFVAFNFAFLFYSLLVAYLAGGGQLIAEFLTHFFGVEISPFAGSSALVVIFGVVLYLGTRSADMINRVLMAGLGLAYGGLVLLGIPHVEVAHLAKSSWKYAFPALPAMIISFGYHNLIPSLTDYLRNNRAALRKAVMWGSMIPLLFYLIWDGVVIGMLAESDLRSAIEEGTMVTSLLRKAVGYSLVVDLIHLFALFALVTSFLAVSLSFVDFLADGLKTAKSVNVMLVLVPPCIFSYLYPYIFLTALNYAGAFGAVILFGIIPVLMVWKGRYVEGRTSHPLLGGGKVTLSMVALFAAFVFCMQLKNELGF